MWLNWWMVCRVIWVLVPPVISWPTHCSWQHSTLHGVRRISHCPNILQMVYFRRLPTDSHYARMTTFVELERLHVHTKKTIRQNRDKTNKHKIREWKVFSQSISNWNSTRQTVYIDSISFGALFLAKFICGFRIHNDENTICWAHAQRVWTRWNYITATIQPRKLHILPHTSTIRMSIVLHIQFVWKYVPQTPR